MAENLRYVQELKFRGKRKDYNKWISGSLLQRFDDRTVYIDGHCPRVTYIYPMDNTSLLKSLNDGYEVIPQTVCLYTGLEINEVEVYSNDIIRHREETDDGYIDTYFLVIWEDSSFKAVNINERFDIDYLSDFIYYGSSYPNSVEVIGNIFDNPEYLSEEMKYYAG